MKLIIHVDDNSPMFDRICNSIRCRRDKVRYTSNRIFNAVLNCSIMNYIDNGGDVDDTEIVIPLAKYRFLPETGIYITGGYSKIQQLLNNIVAHCRDNNLDISRALADSDDIDIYQMYDIYNKILGMVEPIKNRNIGRSNMHTISETLEDILEGLDPVKKGKLIAIEGCDCVGKDYIIDKLDIEGKYINTREPGGTDISYKIRELLLDKSNYNMDATTEGFLYSASRSQHVQEKIIPSIQAGISVITNRYYYSTLIYQMVRGVAPDVLLDMTAVAIDGMVPDLTISLYSDNFGLIRNRLYYKENKDRMEQAEVNVFERINDCYAELDTNIDIANFERDQGKNSRIECIDVNNTDKIIIINELINNTISQD